MAIAPRTVIRNPALLALTSLAATAVAAGGLFIMAFSCSKAPTHHTVYEMPTCNYVADSQDQAAWSEYDYVNVVSCFDDQNDHVSALNTARAGLQHYPSSEVLWNLRGYQEIELQDYEAAVATLRTGLTRVTPTNGVMENNLAWAGLWASRTMDLREARRHYTASLERDPSSCEALHTGLWTEYAVAVSKSDTERKDAMKRYDALRVRYSGCEQRLDPNNLNTVEEVLGAATIDFEMSRLDAGARGPQVWAAARSSANLARQALNTASSAGVQDVEALCAASTPVPSAQHACMQVAHLKKPCR